MPERGKRLSDFHDNDLGVQPQAMYWQCVIGPVEGLEEWPEDPPAGAARARSDSQGSWHPVGFTSTPAETPYGHIVLWTRAYVIENRTLLAEWKASRG